MVNCLSINQKRRKIFKALFWCGLVRECSFSLSIVLHAPLITEWQLKRSSKSPSLNNNKKCRKKIEEKWETERSIKTSKTTPLHCNCQSIYRWNNSIIKSNNRNYPKMAFNSIDRLISFKDKMCDKTKQIEKKIRTATRSVNLHLNLARNFSIF